MSAFRNKRCEPAKSWGGRTRWFRFSRLDAGRVPPSAASAMRGLWLLVGCCVSTWPSTASAWIFSEHTRITATALERLRKEDPWGPVLTEAWLRVREAERWACTEVEREVGEGDCFGFAALPSLAADHSCNPEELESQLASEPWPARVIEASRQVAERLLVVKDDAVKREDIRRGMHIDLQSVDGDYLTRAKGNGAHFQLEREAYDHAAAPVRLDRYLEQSLGAGQDANATALYANYHAAAVLFGRAARKACRSGSTDCSLLSKKGFLAEAFALHFLEDSFAAGHVVGARGNSSYRMGTHDYYSRHGIDARTWRGTSLGIRGDAFLSDETARLASEAVATSMRQLLAAFHDASLDAQIDAELAHTPVAADFNSCTQVNVPAGLRRLAYSKLVAQVVEYEPIPTSRGASMPRFRAEVGPFLGAAATVDGGAAGDGMLLVAATALRAGVGFAAISTARMDNQIFVDLGFAAQRFQSMSYTGYSLRIHAPFLFVPLDGIPAGILAALFPSSGWLTNWATRAASSGFLGLGLQSQVGLTDNLTFQVSLLRDASLLIFHNEPAVGYSKYDLLLPVVTFRYALPFGGLVTSDSILDIGFLGTGTTAPNSASAQYGVGGYVSFSTERPRTSISAAGRRVLQSRIARRVVFLGLLRDSARRGVRTESQCLPPNVRSNRDSDPDRSQQCIPGGTAYDVARRCGRYSTAQRNHDRRVGLPSLARLAPRRRNLDGIRSGR